MHDAASPIHRSPSHLVDDGDRITKWPLSRRSFVALQFDDEPLRQIVRIGALAGWTRQPRAGAVSPSKRTRSPGVSPVVFAIFQVRSRSATTMKLGNSIIAVSRAGTSKQW